VSYPIGWFATGRGSGSYGLLESMQQAIESGYAPAKIAFVFMSREAGEGAGSDRFTRLVKSYGIPLIQLSYRKFKAKYGDDSGNPNALPAWRLDYDREVMRRLADFDVNISVLAGFMLVVGPEMCARYDLLNLHPAAPGGPAGTWIEVINQLIQSGAKASGVMTHLVTPELDRGPVVSYATFPIRGPVFDPLLAEIPELPTEGIKPEEITLFSHIRAHGVLRERPLVTATVKAFAEGRVSITADKQLVDAAGQPLRGYDLTGEIDRLVATAD
jgi:phosphoribosylglycinamide formyltransferase 1